MAQSFATGEKEIWESTIDGRISVEVINGKGRPQTISVLGKGARLRLNTEERELVEEGIRDPQNNPFGNGMLINLNRKDATGAGLNELSDTDLAQVFDLKGPDFEETVKSLSEINVRRLKAMVKDKDASASQVEFLTVYIAESWPIGADTPANAEARGDRTVTV